MYYISWEQWKYERAKLKTQLIVDIHFWNAFFIRQILTFIWRIIVDIHFWNSFFMIVKKCIKEIVNKIQNLYIMFDKNLWYNFLGKNLSSFVLYIALGVWFPEKYLSNFFFEIFNNSLDQVNTLPLNHFRGKLFTWLKLLFISQSDLILVHEGLAAWFCYLIERKWLYIWSIKGDFEDYSHGPTF